MRVRDDELDEMDQLKQYTEVEIRDAIENRHGKINLLLQTYISNVCTHTHVLACPSSLPSSRLHVGMYPPQVPLRSFTLISDRSYVIQSAGRISRALFEIALHRGWSGTAERMLTLCKCIDRRMVRVCELRCSTRWPHTTHTLNTHPTPAPLQWWNWHPLRQFRHLSFEVLRKLEDRGADLYTLLDMSAREIGDLIRHPRAGDMVHDICLQVQLSAMQFVGALPTLCTRHPSLNLNQVCALQIPHLEIDATIQPITRGVLRVNLTVTPAFTWSEKMHHGAEAWWIWVEDAESERIYHKEYFSLQKKQVPCSWARFLPWPRAVCLWPSHHTTPPMVLVVVRR